jgi:hypothetical protein
MSGTFLEVGLRLLCSGLEGLLGNHHVFSIIISLDNSINEEEPARQIDHSLRREMINEQLSFIVPVTTNSSLERQPPPTRQIAF